MLHKPQMAPMLAHAALPLNNTITIAAEVEFTEELFGGES
jgi:hypothetical protein